MSKAKNTFTEFLEKRRTDYKIWVPVYSSVLREHVYFNARGCNHLRFHINNTPRNPEEVMYKLGLLPLVRPIIHSSTKVDQYERRLAPIGGGRKIVLKEM